MVTALAFMDVSEDCLTLFYLDAALEDAVTLCLASSLLTMV